MYRSNYKEGNGDDNYDDYDNNNNATLIPKQTNPTYTSNSTSTSRIIDKLPRNTNDKNATTSTSVSSTSSPLSNDITLTTNQIKKLVSENKFAEASQLGSNILHYIINPTNNPNNPGLARLFGYLSALIPYTQNRNTYDSVIAAANIDKYISNQGFHDAYFSTRDMVYPSISKKLTELYTQIETNDGNVDSGLLKFIFTYSYMRIKIESKLEAAREIALQEDILGKLDFNTGIFTDFNVIFNLAMSYGKEYVKLEKEIDLKDSLNEILVSLLENIYESTLYRLRIDVGNKFDIRNFLFELYTKRKRTEKTIPVDVLSCHLIEIWCTNLKLEKAQEVYNVIKVFPVSKKTTFECLCLLAIAEQNYSDKRDWLVQLNEYLPSKITLRIELDFVLDCFRVFGNVTQKFCQKRLNVNVAAPNNTALAVSYKKIITFATNWMKDKLAEYIAFIPLNNADWKTELVLACYSNFRPILFITDVKSEELVEPYKEYLMKTFIKYSGSRDFNTRADFIILSDIMKVMLNMFESIDTSEFASELLSMATKYYKKYQLAIYENQDKKVYAKAKEITVDLITYFNVISHNKGIHLYKFQDIIKKLKSMPKFQADAHFVETADDFIRMLTQKDNMLYNNNGLNA